MKRDSHPRWRAASLSAALLTAVLPACADFSGITPQAKLSDAAALGLAAGGFTPQQSLAMIDRLANQPAYMLAADDIFFASAITFVAMVPLVFLTRNTRASTASAEAASGAH